MANVNEGAHKRSTWDKGRVVGQKPPLKLREIRALRVRLEITNHHRDLVKLKVRDVAQGTNFLKRAMVIQQKTLHLTASKIRNHSADAGIFNNLDRFEKADFRRLSVSKPHPPLRASQYQAVCADRKVLGCTNWLAPCGLRNPLIA
jgi:hypothetical protein